MSCVTFYLLQDEIEELERENRLHHQQVGDLHFLESLVQHSLFMQLYNLCTLHDCMCIFVCMYVSIIITTTKASYILSGVSL